MIITAPILGPKPAMGKYQELTFVVTSDNAIVGEVIYVRPAMFLKEWVTTTPDVPTSGYQATYPTSGTTEMTLFGVGDSLKNGRVLIEYVTPKVFKLHFRFINHADWDSYIGESAINNQDRFTSKSFDPVDSVYDVLSYFVFDIVIGDEAETVNFIYQANYYTSNVEYWLAGETGNSLTGFSTTEDTSITYKIDDTQISNDHYFGIIRLDDIDNSQDYPTDLELQYAFIDFAANQADQFPFSLINDAGGIQLVGSDYFGWVVIDKDYFTSGGTYRFIVAYKKNNSWRSFLSEEITEDTTKDAVYGDVSYKVQTYDSNSRTYAASCVEGLIPGERVKIFVTMDKPSYLDKAQLEGVGGNFDDNFQSVDIYIADEQVSLEKGGLSAGNDPNNLITQPADVEITDSSGSYEVCTTFRIPESWDSKVITFVWTFDLGDHTDYIYTPVVLEMVSENTTVITNPSWKDDDNQEITDVICSTYEGDINATFDIDLSDVMDIIPVFTKNGKNLEEDLYVNTNLDRIQQFILTGDASADSGDTQIEYTIDASLLTPRQEYCLKFLLKQDLSDTTNPDPDDCDCFDFDASQTVDSFNNFTTELTFEYDAPTLTDDDVTTWTVKARTTDGDVLFTQVFGTSSGSITFTYPTPLTATMIYTFFVVLSDGCTQAAEFTLQTLVDNNESTEVSNSDICDPDDGIIFFSAGCFNHPTIDLECNDVSDVVEASSGGTLLSTPTSDVLFYGDSFDGPWTEYTNPVDADYWWRHVEFSDACPTVDIYEVIDCDYTPLDCEISGDIITDYDPDGQTLSLSDLTAYACTEVSDIMEYSEDGVSWTEYVSDIDVTSIDELILRVRVLCDDDCGEIIYSETWDKSNKINCDYSSFDLTVTYDEGLNVHSASRVNTDADLLIDTLEYSIDGGETYSTYSTAVSADAVLFVRTLQYEGCDPYVIQKVSVRSCCDVLTDLHRMELFDDLSSGNEVEVSQAVNDVVGVYRNGVFVSTDVWTRTDSTFTFTDRNFMDNEWVIIVYTT